MTEAYSQLDRDHKLRSFTLTPPQSVVATGDQVRGGRGDPWRALLARMMLPFCSRGGGRGEDIALDVLAILRRHNVREGPDAKGGEEGEREEAGGLPPGGLIEDRFLEQWRRKLAQNTTPDDVIIAAAYIAFLERRAPSLIRVRVGGGLRGGRACVLFHPAACRWSPSGVPLACFIAAVCFCQSASAAGLSRSLFFAPSPLTYPPFRLRRTSPSSRLRRTSHCSGPLQ